MNITWSGRLEGLAACVVAAVILVVACTDTDDQDPAPLDRVGLVGVTEIARLPEPGTDAVMTPTELLIAGREGRVFRIPVDGSGRPLDERPDLDRTLDFRSGTSTEGERGLLGLALVPDTDQLVLSRTTLDGTLVVQRIDLEATGPAVDSADTIMSIPMEDTYHNGGALVLHDNGDLYVGVGDDEKEAGPDPAPQDPESPLGSIVRIPAEMLAGTHAASGFQPTADDLVAIGLRNPWRLSLESDTGDIWIGDVGGSRQEEVSVLRDGKTGTPQNFGWPIFEGTQHLDLGLDEPENYVAPVLTLDHGPGVCAIIGGYVYRGTAIAGLQGAYVFGDYCSNEVRAFMPSNGGAAEVSVISELSAPVISFARTADGELMALDRYGGVWLLGGAAPAGTERAPDRSRGAACEFVTVLTRLGEAHELDPHELEQSYREVADQLQELVSEGGDQMARAASELQPAIRRVSAVGARTDWDPGAVSQAQELVNSGDSEFPYAKIAATELLDRLGEIC